VGGQSYLHYTVWSGIGPATPNAKDSPTCAIKFLDLRAPAEVCWSLDNADSLLAVEDDSIWVLGITEALDDVVRRHRFMDGRAALELPLTEKLYEKDIYNVKALGLVEMRHLERCNAKIKDVKRLGYIKKIKEKQGKDFMDWRVMASDSFNVQIYLNKRKTRLVAVFNQQVYRVFQVNESRMTLDYFEVKKTKGKPPFRKWFLAYHHDEDEYRLVELKKDSREPVKRYPFICDR